MRFVSPVILGAMLAVAGMTGVAMAPAAHAKEKAAKAPKLKLTPSFVPLIAKANDLVAKKDIEGAKAAMALAEPAAVSNDDKYQYYSILLNLSIAANDAAMQGKALSGMLDSGLVPAEQLGQFNAIAAKGDVAAKNYDKALERAQIALNAGYNPGDTNVTISQAYWGKAGTSKLSVEPARSLVAQGLSAFRAGIDAMKAAGQAVPEQWYQVAVAKADAAGLPEIRDWASMAFQASPTGENLRTVLRVFQRTYPQMSNRENLDVLRLMNVSGGLRIKPDYLEYAEMAFKAGTYGEVQSAIGTGRSKGVLSASDGAELLGVAVGKIAADKASLGTAEADANRAANGKVAAAAADAFLGYGDYAKAASLYRLALQKGVSDMAEGNTRLGIALAMAGDVAGARDAFGKVTGGLRGELAGYWLKWLENKPAA